MQEFIRYGFVTSNLDPCILIHMSEAVLIDINVDNITLYSPSSLMIKNFKNTLKSEFEVTDLADLHWLLGIQIKVRPKGIELSQTIYIHSILS
jgi:hypothetical protein